MRTQIEIQQAFRVYEIKMSRVYQELISIKESCSYRDQELLMEGFWDKLKSAASGAGAFLGKTTQKVSNFSDDIYNKGIELGKKAVDIGNELVSKVSEVTKNAVSAIRSTPSRLFDACNDIYASVSNEIGEIYKKAKEKGGEFLENAKTTIANMYSKVASGLSEGITAFKSWASKNSEEFKKLVQDKRAELLEAAKSAENSTIEIVKKIGFQMKSFYEKGKDVAKNVAFFAVSMLVLPFYASYLLTKKAYDLGEETVNVISSGIQNIKTNVPDVWSEFTRSFQETRELEKKPVTERYIKTFEGFLYRNY